MPRRYASSCAIAFLDCDHALLIWQNEQRCSIDFVDFTKIPLKSPLCKWFCIEHHRSVGFFGSAHCVCPYEYYLIRPCNAPVVVGHVAGFRRVRSSINYTSLHYHLKNIADDFYGGR